MRPYQQVHRLQGRQQLSSVTWMLARSNSESTLISTPFSTASSSSRGSLPLPAAQKRRRLS